MVADISVRNFTATIDILDSDKNTIQAGIDVAPVIESLSLSRPQFDTRTPNSYHPCTGTITLKAFNNYNFTTSTDTRDTASSPSGAQIYSFGNRLNLTIADSTGTLQPICPLYLTETPDPANLGSNPLVLTIGDESQLIDYDDTPEGDFSGVTRGTARFASAIANTILTLNDLPTSADVVSDYPIAVELQKNNTSSWDKFIGGLLACRGYYFWLDSSGAPRFTTLDFEQGAPALSLTIGGDNGDELDETNGWIREKQSSFPPRTLNVYATGSTPVELDNPSNTSQTIQGDGFTAKTIDITKTWDFGTTPETVTRTQERTAEKLILPRLTTTQEQTVDISREGVTGTAIVKVITDITDNTSTALRDSLDKTETIEYSNLTGKRDRSVVVERIARGLAGGDAHRGTDDNNEANSLIETTTIETIEYSRIDGHMERRETSTTKPWCLVDWTGDRPPTKESYDANRFTVREVFRKIETWEEIPGNSFGGSSTTKTKRWRYRVEVLRPVGEIEEEFTGINADSLVSDHRESFTLEGSGRDAAPPSPEYQDEEFTRVTEQFEGSAFFTPLAGDAYKLKTDNIRINGPYVISNGQCSFLAQLLGLFRHGRSLGARFVGAIPDWLFTGYFPGARVDVTVEGQILAFILDGWDLVIDQTSAVWGCHLVFVGVVGAAPADITPPVTTSFPVTSNITGPSPIVTASILANNTVTSNITGPSPIVSASIIDNGPSALAWRALTLDEMRNVTLQQWREMQL